MVVAGETRCMPLLKAGRSCLQRRQAHVTEHLAVLRQTILEYNLTGLACGKC